MPSVGDLVSIDTTVGDKLRCVGDNVTPDGGEEGEILGKAVVETGLG